MRRIKHHPGLRWRRVSRLAGAARPADHSRRAGRGRVGNRRRARPCGRLGPHRRGRPRAGAGGGLHHRQSRFRLTTCAAPSTGSCRRAIRVLTAEEAPRGFPPAFRRPGQDYEYRIVRAEVCSPFECALRASLPLSAGRAPHDAAGAGVSKASTISPLSPRRRPRCRGRFEGADGLRFRPLEREGERLIYRVRGSGFLKHMVRNMVGTLIEAGKGNIADLAVLPAESGPRRRPRACSWCGPSIEIAAVSGCPNPHSTRIEI